MAIIVASGHLVWIIVAVLLNVLHFFYCRLIEVITGIISAYRAFPDGKIQPVIGEVKCLHARVVKIILRQPSIWNKDGLGRHSIGLFSSH